jgi:hypothetical protein
MMIKFAELKDGMTLFACTEDREFQGNLYVEEVKVLKGENPNTFTLVDQYDRTWYSNVEKEEFDSSIYGEYFETYEEAAKALEFKPEINTKEELMQHLFSSYRTSIHCNTVDSVDWMKEKIKEITGIIVND